QRCGVRVQANSFLQQGYRAIEITRECGGQAAIMEPRGRGPALSPKRARSGEHAIRFLHITLAKSQRAEGSVHARIIGKAAGDCAVQRRTSLVVATESFQ